MSKIEKNKEEVDAIIRGKLKQFPQTGNKGCSGFKRSWTEEEIEMRDTAILDLVKIMSREQAAQQIKERWGITIITARKYVAQAIKRFADSFEDDYDELKRIFLERCDSIYQSALKDNQKELALKSLDLSGKALGVYKEQKDVNLSGNVNITFDI